MNNKDSSVSSRVGANVQEMDVVLSECHDRFVVSGERGRRLLDEVPRDGC